MVLENVSLKEDGHKLVPDYFDVSKTENGRVSYPIFHIDNYVSHKHIFFTMVYLDLNKYSTYTDVCNLFYVGIKHKWQDTQKYYFLDM